MGTPLWLTAIVAVLAPAAVLWSVHRTDRRERATRDAAVNAEYRQARRDAYTTYLNSLSFIQLMSITRATAMPDWYAARSDELLIAENAMRIYATPLLRDLAKSTTGDVVASLRAIEDGQVSDKERDDMFVTFQYLQDLLAIAIRDELEVSLRLDGEKPYVRSWRSGFIKRSNSATRTSRDLANLQAAVRARNSRPTDPTH